MMGTSHRIGGVAAWVAAAPLLHVGGWQYPAGFAVAGAFAHGRLSPDMDRYPILRRLIPGGHRGITHWWPVTLAWWPVGLAILTATAQAGRWRWTVLAVAVGWASHLAGDAIFGRIPIWPRLHRRGKSRWRYAGLGLQTNGGIEHCLMVPGMIAATGWMLWRLPAHGTTGWHTACWVAFGWLLYRWVTSLPTRRRHPAKSERGR